MSVNASQEEAGANCVWLRVRILNSVVLSFRTTVREIRVSFREAVQTFSARRRIIGSVSAIDHRATADIYPQSALGLGTFA
jgi:hypothetical protein